MNLPKPASSNRPFHPLSYPIHSDWQPLFLKLEQEQWFQILLREIGLCYTTKELAPKSEYLWRSFETTSLKDLRGIMLGQDPYPSPGFANGLAFSVQPGLTIPASLRTIFFELKRSHQIEPSSHGDLTEWALQGLLLINSSLILDMSTKKPPTTIRPAIWSKLSYAIIHYISQQKRNFFILAMGKKAQQMVKEFEHLPNIYILKTAHPSPLAAIGKGATPFIGCEAFSKIDAYLEGNQLPKIVWNLPACDGQSDNHPH